MIGLALALALQTYPLTQLPVPTDGGVPVSGPQAAAAAPVASVNAMKGAVTVPGTIRASCVISSFDSSGNGSCALANWTGGTAFTSTPDCFPTLQAGSSTYVYALPLVTPPGAAGGTVAINEQAALKVLNVALGASTIWGPPPAGTSITMACRGT
jgi:hypothetical protein